MSTAWFLATHSSHKVWDKVEEEEHLSLTHTLKPRSWPSSILPSSSSQKQKKQTNKQTKIITTAVYFTWSGADILKETNFSAEETELFPHPFVSWQRLWRSCCPPDSTHALQNMQLNTAAAFPLKLGLSGPHPQMFREFSDGGRSRQLQRIRGWKRLRTKTGCRYFKLC